VRVWSRGVPLAELESLYRARFDHFARVGSAITGDGESGRDAVQNAFAAAVRGRGSFRGTGSLEAWLWRIVVNEANRLRREPVHVALDEFSERSVNGHGGVDDLGVRELFADLPDRQREVLFLRYHADLDYRRIAEILEIEVGTVSATLSAAHTKLRKTLRKVER
jgi:RNA polymerase sigma-70 factor, ECF subfamily